MSGGIPGRRILAGALMAGVLAGQSPLKVTVLVYDYARAPAETLSSAKRVASGIYADIGIAVEFVEYARVRATPADRTDPDPNRFELRLLSRSMVDRLKPGRDEIARALLAEDGAFGSLADVYMDRLLEFCRSRHAAAGPVLGNVLAHELGHLLLGPVSHSQGGIMRARWDKKDVDNALQRRLVFTTLQARTLREQVIIRIGALCQAQSTIDRAPGLESGFRNAMRCGQGTRFSDLLSRSAAGTGGRSCD